MKVIIEVVYENSVFKPLKPLESLGVSLSDGEKLTVEIKVESGFPKAKADRTPEIKILDVKELRPTKPYAEMEDYGEIRRFKVFAKINNNVEKFTIYELLEEIEDNMCYVVNGHCKRLESNRNKIFTTMSKVYFSRLGAYLGRWNRDTGLMKMK
ncbi:Uncharacterized protein conserved in archaea [Archaeoglobus sulfaticallidus PM70-1]|uniref:Antitoxin n=1 Tax=Archaeoglobus sulfaticallidus PM70-1 TaxID=387631 RepID=N0BEA9_9EURY|nr:antitoxin family protein [Archaeoglobus sulfaticallidus]AGK61353.1 Uncharacterized protein conserved in archaea [Archaeoglobus sulfaticallidus PM70-1]